MNCSRLKVYMVYVIVCAFIGGLCGCFSTGEKAEVRKVKLTRFKESECEFSLKGGTGIIEGDLFARQQGGGVVPGAGSTVYLAPYSAHILGYWGSYHVVKEYDYNARGYVVVDEYYLGQDKFDSRRADKYIKIATANSKGEFRFRNLAAGRYIVHGMVTWRAGSQKQISVATEVVTVERRETTEVSLYDSLGIGQSLEIR